MYRMIIIHQINNADCMIIIIIIAIIISSIITIVVVIINIIIIIIIIIINIIIIIVLVIRMNRYWFLCHLFIQYLSITMILFQVVWVKCDEHSLCWTSVHEI